MMRREMVLRVPDEINPLGVEVRMAWDGDESLFCLADVCSVLEIANPRMVAERLDDDEKTTVSLADGAGGPPRTFVTEAGLYTVLLRSDKPQAKPFRRWVTHEVIPCIRKHGCYPAPAVRQDGTAAPPDFLVMVRQEFRSLVESMRPVALPAKVPADHVDPREYIADCWPGCPEKIVRQIIRRAKSWYEYRLGQLPPQMSPEPNAPTLFERQHLWAVTRALAEFWRREHPTDQGDIGFAA